MGAIRGFFLVIVSVLLFLSLFSFALFLTLTSSLDYNNLQNESKIVIKEMLKENMNINSVIDDAYPFIQIYCQNNSEYVLSFQDYTFAIPCNITTNGKEFIVDNGIDYLIKGIYYRDYGCQFLDCFGKSEIPTFLFSIKSYTFLKNIFYTVFAISFLLILLVFFLVEKKTNLPLLLGGLMIVSSLPFLKIKSFIQLIPNESAIKIVGLFFSNSNLIAIQILIAGIVLLIVGFILKLFKTGFSISNILSKFNKPENKSPKIAKNTKSK